MNINFDFLKRRDLVLISSINWAENWQIHQQLATSLVESGHRVLFVENTGVRSPRKGDLSRVYDRIHNWVRSTRGFIGLKENLTIYCPMFIPLPYSRLALFLNRSLLSQSIKRWMQIEVWQPPIVISFLPTPLAQSLINDINPLLVIYYCADDMAERANEPKLNIFEEAFFRRVDSVFCTSHALLDRASKFSKSTHFFPAGVDFQKFETIRYSGNIHEELSDLAKPVVGYVGTIGIGFDQNMLASAARAMPEASFVLVGPVMTDVSALKAYSNVKFMGMRPHDDVPRFIKGFDVALIPFIKTAFTDAIYSCKLNEYLAMGVPVVATDMRELRSYIEDHGNVIEIAGTQEEFIDKICRESSTPSEFNRVMRIAAAHENSWVMRFDGICVVIEQLLFAKSNNKLNWQERLSNYYRLGRMKMAKIALTITLCYGGFFYSPLLWYAGDLLVMRQIPTPSDAIVVFSGDGDSGYKSMNYQNRAQDALTHFHSKYSDLIVLASGKGQVISEAEVVRALLMEHGVPPEKISVIEKISSSTVENIKLTLAELNRSKAHKIIFITAPYHSLRAHLVWRKLAPELNISTVAVVDTPSNQPSWHTSHEMAKLILYEYLVIVYYWWIGWI
jgi:glycosyltransferase involved in cell wall biosynthesis/uncharacterized SAM-binding protein YcdF (DUF218 family)